MEVSHLIECLSSPAAFAHPVQVGDFQVGDFQDIAVRQTHISVVFLSGPFAYKVKKPVNLGFVDFSTLPKRRFFCDEEVRLNRRLAPHVYLGVVPIVGAKDGLRFEGDGEPVEWAVKMQRLPEAATLQQRLRRDEVSPATVEMLARRIALFHQAAQSNETIASFGRFEAVSQNLLDILRQSQAHVGQTVHADVFAKLRQLIEATLSRLRPLIDGRAEHGWTRDTHGDLHLDHIYHFPGRQPPEDYVIIDCIEFNDRFRFIDTVADMAFAYMDFCYYGRRDLAGQFARAYFTAIKDEDGRALLPLYAAYRASVRGSVEGMKCREPEVSELDRLAALQRARAYWLLALGLLAPPAQRPGLLLIGGLPGTGKSTVARHLAERAGFQVVRSDMVRKELAGLSPSQPASPQLRADLYTSQWNDRTYADCLERVDKLLFAGKRVIVDASFREDHRRQHFLETAVRWGVPAAMILCRAGPETVRRRLEKRHAGPSDADWAVYQWSAHNWQEPSPVTQRFFHEMPMVESEDDILAWAMRIIQKMMNDER